MIASCERSLRRRPRAGAVAIRARTLPTGRDVSSRATLLYETERLANGRSEMRLTSDRLVGLRGPLLLVSLCATPLVLWALAAPLDLRFQGRYQTLTSIAVLLAF